MATNSPVSVRTLREMAGASAEPAPLKDSVLIIIDAQKEYESGALPLAGFKEAVEQIARLLVRARHEGITIVHVVHKGKAGAGLFNPEGKSFEIADALKPQTGEIIVEKSFPSAFTQTSLDQHLQAAGKKNLIMVGFMTHMCVNSTTRAAAELGYTCTVVAAACATRDLPDGLGGVLPAETVHRVHLAGLADRFAIVVSNVSAIK